MNPVTFTSVTTHTDQSSSPSQLQFLNVTQQADMTVAFTCQPIWHIFSASCHISFRLLQHVLPSCQNSHSKTRASHDHRVHAELTVHSSTTPHNIYFHRFPKITVTTLIFIHCALMMSTLRRENAELTTTNLEITQMLFFLSRSCRRGSVRIERWWPAGCWS